MGCAYTENKKKNGGKEIPFTESPLYTGPRAAELKEERGFILQAMSKITIVHDSTGYQQKVCVLS